MQRTNKQLMFPDCKKKNQNIVSGSEFPRAPKKHNHLIFYFTDVSQRVSRWRERGSIQRRLTFQRTETKQTNHIRGS